MEKAESAHQMILVQRKTEMKITKNKLKQIIREEIENILEGHGRRRARMPDRKFTHPNYPGVTFTEKADVKSGYPEYVGVDDRGQKIRIDPFRNPDEYKKMKPMEE